MRISPFWQWTIYLVIILSCKMKTWLCIAYKKNGIVGKRVWFNSMIASNVVSSFRSCISENFDFCLQFCYSDTVELMGIRFMKGCKRKKIILRSIRRFRYSFNDATEFFLEGQLNHEIWYCIQLETINFHVVTWRITCTKKLNRHWQNCYIIFVYNVWRV